MALSLRDHARAALITLHLLAIGLIALPSPVGVKRKDFDDPMMAEALAPVSAILGVDTTDEAFLDRLYEGARSFLRLRAAVLRPFGPYYRYAGTRQSWRMFGVVNDKPARVEILLSGPGGEEEPLYIARDPEHAWRRHQLDQERFRAYLNDYSWRRDRRSWRAFSDWVAVQAAADFPDATGVTLRLRYMPILAAEAMLALDERPLGKTFWEEERSLTELRSPAPGVGP